MASKKGKKTPLWSSPKVLRIIEELGWDKERFEKAYRMAVRSDRGAVPLSEDDLAAVKRYLKDGDKQALRLELRLKEQR